MSMRQSVPRLRSTPRSMRGLSLIELMIALMLGLLVVGGAIGIFLSNQQAYRATESLSRIQENARVAFELMSRDIREAAGTPCAKSLPVANVLKDSTTRWWSNWGEGIHGYDGNQAITDLAFGTAQAQRINGTAAVDILSASAFPGLTVVDNNPDHNSNSANFKLNQPPGSQLEDGDIVLVCDYRQAAILQITNVQDTSATVVHNTGGSQSPGNCSKGLGVPTVCTTNGNRYEYGANSLMVRLMAARWYVGNAPGGGRSLYRIGLRANSGNAVAQPEEVIPGVQDLQLWYLLPNAANYVTAAGVAGRWSEVLAVRVEIQLEGAEQRVGTDGNPLERTLEHIVSLRNRNP